MQENAWKMQENAEKCINSGKFRKIRESTHGKNMSICGDAEGLLNNIQILVKHYQRYLFTFLS